MDVVIDKNDSKEKTSNWKQKAKKNRKCSKTENQSEYHNQEMVLAKEKTEKYAKYKKLSIKTVASEKSQIHFKWSGLTAPNTNWNIVSLMLWLLPQWDWMLFT